MRKSLTGFLTLLLCGCTILEDRTLCPCRLTMDYSKVLKYDFVHRMANGEYDVILIGEDFNFNETIPTHLIETIREKSVSKGSIRISGVLSKKGKEPLIVTEGNQADSLYAFSTTIEATGEKAYVLMEAHKQFTTVHIKESNVENAESGRHNRLENVQMKVKGNFTGIDRQTLEPLPGKFECMVPKATPVGEYSVRIPRQGDASIMMELILDGVNEETTNSQGRLTLPLGRYMEESGYDFEAESLADIYLELDIVTRKAFIRVENWNFEKIFVIY
ncbi:MAG: hypothetical protein GXY75_03415 [Bacteroidales bacterium]|jgi:hypothetical protein|nr:hypothetical protein [Bacteroidales bacterium]